MSIKAKRIVLAATSDLTHDRRLIRICTSLKAAGSDVLLIGREAPASVALTLRPYRQKRIKCLFNTTALFYIEFNIRLLFRLLVTRADAIVANDLDTLPAARIAAWFKGCRLVYDAHEYFTEVPELNGRKFVKRIWELIARVCIPGVNICYTVSGSLAQVLSERYRKEFHTITNAPWPIEYRPLEKNNPKPVLIYRGDINQGRGIEEYIRCMKNIDGILQIAGDGPLRRNLEDLIISEGLENKVVFTGRLDREDLDNLTANATIGLNMLDSNSLSYYYSLGNKFFDYIQARLPQVCVDFPEYRALNEKYEVAVLCKNNIGEIESAIRMLLEDRSLYERLRNNCDEAASILNWNAVNKQLVALYGKLW